MRLLSYWARPYRIVHDDLPCPAPSGDQRLTRPARRASAGPLGHRRHRHRRHRHRRRCRLRFPRPSGWTRPPPPPPVPPSTSRKGRRQTRVAATAPAVAKSPRAALTPTRAPSGLGEAWWHASAICTGRGPIRPRPGSTRGPMRLSAPPPPWLPPPPRVSGPRPDDVDTDPLRRKGGISAGVGSLPSPKTRWTIFTVNTLREARTSLPTSSLPEGMVAPRSHPHIH